MGVYERLLEERKSLPGSSLEQPLEDLTETGDAKTPSPAKEQGERGRTGTDSP
jgi:hypothetical protein